ncbi:hypothetical protein Tco_0465272 [Tanacetum coccineum]
MAVPLRIRWMILSPSFFSTVKTSDNFEKFPMNLLPLDSLPPGKDIFDSEGVHSFSGYILLSDDDSHNLASEGNMHQNSVIESLPISPIPVEDSEPTQEEIDIFLVPDDLIPPGVEDADSEDVFKSSN